MFWRWYLDTSIPCHFLYFSAKLLKCGLYFLSLPFPHSPPHLPYPALGLPEPIPSLPLSPPLQKSSGEDSQITQTKSLVSLPSVCPLSDIWRCRWQHLPWKVFFLIWSSWDVAGPLNPSHLSSTPWSSLLALLPSPYLWVSQKHLPPSLTGFVPLFILSLWKHYWAHARG